jgi:DNA-binding LytR/AlgR family response regulator
MITYIIVDDETASHDIIEDYGNNLTYLTLKKNCYNAFEAMEYLREHKIDLMFLDINMPKLTGFDFLRTLSNPPKIIVTTAYEEFALEGFELNIDDYLLKPFSFQRFLKAVTKVNDLLAEEAKVAKSMNADPSNQSLFIKGYKKHYQVKLDDILFVEAYGNYVKINMEDKMIVSHQTLTSFIHHLPDDQFIRVHKSFIVSLDRIDSVEGNRILIQKHEIPIGKMYRLNVNRLIKN